MFLQQLLPAPLPWHGASSIHPLTPLYGLDAAPGTSLRARRCWQGPPPYTSFLCIWGFFMAPEQLGSRNGSQRMGTGREKPAKI